jgi:manganese transport protein
MPSGRPRTVNRRTPSLVTIASSHAHQTSPGPRRGIRRRLSQVGPALVLATVVLGPGSLTLHTIAGSTYGYGLLWVPIVATLFMMVYTWLAARIGLVTGQTLFDLARRKYGAGVARVGGLFAFLAVLAFQAGNSAAVGFAANAIVGVDVRLAATVLLVPALALVMLPNLYRKLELLVKVFVGLLIVAFLGTLVLVGVRLDAALPGLVPSFPDGEAIFLTLGMAATSFSIAAAVYQGYLMREKAWGPDDLSTEGFDTFVGIGILGSISIAVLLTSAGALHATGTPVFSAQGMAAQLEPLAGPAAFYLFVFGFFFASFSSLIVNPMIGATLLADGFGMDSSMDGRPVKRCTAVGLFAGLAVVLAFEGSPVELLRIAQALAVVAFPLLGLFVLAIARDRSLMGEHATGNGLHAIALVGYFTILAIVVAYARLVLAAL